MKKRQTATLEAEKAPECRKTGGLDARSVTAFAYKIAAEIEEIGFTHATAAKIPRELEKILNHRAYELQRSTSFTSGLTDDQKKQLL